MRRAMWIFVLFGLALGFPGGVWLKAQSAPETSTFAASPGDTLVIQNDYGRIQVRGSDGSQVVARTRKTSSGQTAIETIAQKSGDKIFFYSFFSGAAGESVDLEVQAPRFANVVIWGANPEIEITDIQGFVRGQNFTGQMRAEGLTSSVSLISDRGDIRYRATAQPQGDIRLETAAGTVWCELAANLNLRGWLRAGGRAVWGSEGEQRGVSIEKQLGTFGPLLYAGSLRGDVRVVLQDSSRSPAVASPAAPPGIPRPQPPTPSPGSLPQASGRTSAEAGRPNPPLQPEYVPPPDRPAPAQPSISPVERAGADKYALKVNVDSVYMNVSVRDPHTNRSITGLRKQDFAVWEDRVPQEIAQLESTEAPFNLLLLLDVSGSTRSFIDLMKSASIDFTNELKGNDRVALATFNSDVRLVRDLTDDRRDMARAIQGVRSGGGTAFYDALLTSVDDYMRDIEGRKAIVVFTDGVDNALEGNMSDGSKTPFEYLYRRVQEIDTIIYTIFLDTEGYMNVSRSGGSSGAVIDILGGVLGGRFPRRTPNPYPNPGPSRRGNPAVYDEARDQLLALAEQTGGRMYAPRRIEDLSRTYSEIADDLRIQYLLGYNSSNPARDGRWRAIHVETPSYSDAVVRTRKGYYASGANSNPRPRRP